MNGTTAYLELKYGWVYGGSPKFHIISEIALMIHNHNANNILIFAKPVNGTGRIVTSYSETDEYGVTKKRHVEVLDLSNRRTYPYDPEFELPMHVSKNIVSQSYNSHRFIKSFIISQFMKYRPSELVVYGGRRDILLCEKAGVRFDKIRRIVDTQELLKKETEHLFSLNKISNIIGFEKHSNRIQSLNYEYYLPRHIMENMGNNSASFDAARAFLVHQEFTNHKQNLLIKAALQLQRIETLNDEGGEGDEE